jgi:uncharacterized membrane protein
MQGKQVLRWIVLAALGAGYLWLGHWASVSDDPPLLSLLIGLAPLSFSAVLLAWHSGSVWLQALCAACLLAVLLNLDFLRVNTAWVYFIQHVGMHTLLGIMFGRTLGKGHEAALCSSLSKLVYAPPLDEKFFRYAWIVTIVWTAYFGLATFISTLLFFFASPTNWSIFANLLTPVFIGGIFLVESLTRMRALPHRKHVSISESIRAYREYADRKD